MNSIRDLPKFLDAEELADMKRFGLDGESPNWAAYEALLAENARLTRCFKEE